MRTAVNDRLWRGWMVILLVILMVSGIGFFGSMQPAAAQEDSAEDPPAVEDPVEDSEDTLFEALISEEDGYWTEDGAGNLIRVWFAPGNGGPSGIPAMGPSGVAYVWSYRWDGITAITRSDTYQFRIVDGNLIDLAGLYFVRSFDGVLFQVEWDAVRVFPSAW